jgi:hypothetical protein
MGELTNAEEKKIKYKRGTKINRRRKLSICRPQISYTRAVLADCSEQKAVGERRKELRGGGGGGEDREKCCNVVHL